MPIQLPSRALPALGHPVLHELRVVVAKRRRIAERDQEVGGTRPVGQVGFGQEPPFGEELRGGGRLDRRERGGRGRHAPSRDAGVHDWTSTAQSRITSMATPSVSHGR